MWKIFKTAWSPAWEPTSLAAAQTRADLSRSFLVCWANCQNWGLYAHRVCSGSFTWSWRTWFLLRPLWRKSSWTHFRSERRWELGAKPKYLTRQKSISFLEDFQRTLTDCCSDKCDFSSNVLLRTARKTYRSLHHVWNLFFFYVAQH